VRSLCFSCSAHAKMPVARSLGQTERWERRGQAVSAFEPAGNSTIGRFAAPSSSFVGRASPRRMGGEKMPKATEEPENNALGLSALVEDVDDSDYVPIEKNKGMKRKDVAFTPSARQKGKAKASDTGERNEYAAPPPASSKGAPADIYYCHQNRNKTNRPYMSCSGVFRGKPCATRFCDRCIETRCVACRARQYGHLAHRGWAGILNSCSSLTGPTGPACAAPSHAIATIAAKSAASLTSLLQSGRANGAPRAHGSPPMHSFQRQFHRRRSLAAGRGLLCLRPRSHPL
jgi:hypothetical protein